MRKNMIITFDLDGTLSDPIEGVANSANHALERLGFPPKDRKEMGGLIGPPLREIFVRLLGTDDEKIVGSAISFFREKYYDTGFRENVIYPGVPELLKELANDGHTLHIATNKRTDIAEAVADYFGIRSYFKKILGAGLKKEKHELLEDIRGAETSGDFVMVGDRMYDMRAGKLARFHCVGILWGYGGRKELSEAGADMLCATPDDLGVYIKQLEK